MPAVLQCIRATQDPSSPYSGVLAKFITQMLDGVAPTIFGDGKQSRDFTYVDNVVEANLLACSAQRERSRGTGIQCSYRAAYGLYQTFLILKKLTGYSGQVSYGPERAGDVKHSLADISLAEKHLGYKPKVDFKEGLSRTVAWYRTRELEGTG